MKMTEIICNKCGKKCEKPTKEINRQKKNGRTKFYCSTSCSTTEIKTTTSKINRDCLWCKKTFQSTTHKKGRCCCSKNCARKYAQSKINLETHHQAMIRFGNKIRVFPKIKLFVCLTCGSEFERFVKRNLEIKTCSKKCWGILRSKLSRENPNCGGELGYKHFRYKNVLMDSSWEVDLARWMDKNNIEWDRSRKRYMFWWTDSNGNKRKYFPDFYLPEYNVYLDPKNKYKLANDQYKLDCVIEENKIKLFYGSIDDIKKNLDIIKVK